MDREEHGLRKISKLIILQKDSSRITYWGSERADPIDKASWKVKSEKLKWREHIARFSTSGKAGGTVTKIQNSVSL